MNRFLYGVARAMAESFTLPGPILEVGSYQAAGPTDLINLRGLFPGRPYVGVDFRAGPGVDCVARVEALPQPSASVGTVIAFSTLEHVERFWLGLDEIYRVLRPDGVFLVACPFYFHVHDHPSDYWRFTPQALQSLLGHYPTRVLGWHGPERKPANVWAAAFRESAAAPTPNQLAAYVAKLSLYAREPLPWRRRLGYLLGRCLCGRRPFAPLLDRGRWQTQLHAPGGSCPLGKN